MFYDLASLRLTTNTRPNPNTFSDTSVMRLATRSRETAHYKIVDLLLRDQSVSTNIWYTDTTPPEQSLAKGMRARSRVRRRNPGLGSDPPPRAVAFIRVQGFRDANSALADRILSSHSFIDYTCPKRTAVACSATTRQSVRTADAFANSVSRLRIERLPSSLSERLTPNANAPVSD